MDIASFSHKDTTFSTLVDFPASSFRLFYPHLHFPLIIQCPFRIVALNSYLPHLNHTNDSSAFRMKCTFLSLTSKAHQGLASAYSSSLVPCHSFSHERLQTTCSSPKPSGNFVPSCLCVHLKCPIPLSQSTLTLLFKILPL